MVLIEAAENGASMRKQLLGVAAMLAIVALFGSVSCSRVEISKTGTSQARSPGDQPGVLRILTGRFDTLNTVVSGGGSSVYLSYLWAAYLFIADEKARVVPELATEIPSQANGGISPDGLTITYHLRHGVRWHDGAPFGADDVVFTWHVIMNPKNNVASRIGYDKVASMVALDPYTVRVQLKERYAPVTSSLFGPGEVPLPILPKHILGSLPDINRAPYNLKPIGTGPFIITSYDPAVGVTLAANAYYWRGRPKLRGIYYRIQEDSNTAIVMLRSDEADVGLVSDSHAKELAGVAGIKIIREPVAQNAFLSFNEQHPPFDDVRVRRAIAMAVDRKFFLHVFQYDVGAVANGDQPPFYWSFDPNVSMPAYDLTKARALLDEAGWHVDSATGYRMKDGKQLALTFAYITSRDPDTKYAPIFQNTMKQIGVAVQVKSYPYNVFFAPKNQGGVLDTGNFDVASSGWVLGSDPEEATLWMCDQYPPAGYNWSFACDKRIDDQERIALTSYDQATRKRAYWRIQELLAEDVPAIFLSWVDLFWATRDTVHDYYPGENQYGSWLWRKD